MVGKILYSAVYYLVEDGISLHGAKVIRETPKYLITEDGGRYPKDAMDKAIYRSDQRNPYILAISATASFDKLKSMIRFWFEETASTMEVNTSRLNSVTDDKNHPPLHSATAPHYITNIIYCFSHNYALLEPPHEIVKENVNSFSIECGTRCLKKALNIPFLRSASKSPFIEVTMIDATPEELSNKVREWFHQKAAEI